MLQGKWFIAGLVLIAFSLIIGASITYANIKYAQEGTVQVVTRWGAIERIYAPADGWFTTIAPGRKSYEVNVKSFTETAPVRVTSKDNAALQVEISVTAYTDPNRVADYVRKYGFLEEERHRRRVRERDRGDELGRGSLLCRLAGRDTPMAHGGAGHEPGPAGAAAT